LDYVTLNLHWLEAVKANSQRIEKKKNYAGRETLALSSSFKLPMHNMVTLDAALQETMFFMLFS